MEVAEVVAVVADLVVVASAVAVVVAGKTENIIFSSNATQTSRTFQKFAFIVAVKW